MIAADTIDLAAPDVSPGVDPALVSRLEDAALDASAPPAQRWLDGWLLRLSPEPMQRARCVHALADGTRTFDTRLAQAEARYARAGLPLVFRVTPCTSPGLPEQLQVRGYLRGGDTWVLVHQDLAQFDALSRRASIRPDGQPSSVDAARFVSQTAAWRGTPDDVLNVQLQRVRLAPVALQGWFWQAHDGQVLCGAHTTRDDEIVGLYEVHTTEHARGRGLARALCVHALSQAWRDGARIAYLQVHADNEPALRLYRDLGFVEAYGYHYRAHPEPPAHD